MSRHPFPPLMAPQGYKLIFYGDSIFETLKGTDKCRECENPTRRSSCAGVPAVYRRMFGRFRPGVMAMSMDETAHLLYRLQHGSIPRRNKVRRGLAWPAVPAEGQKPPVMPRCAVTQPPALPRGAAQGGGAANRHQRPDQLSLERQGAEHQGEGAGQGGPGHRRQV